MPENPASFEETQGLLRSLRTEKDVLNNDPQLFRALDKDHDGSILRLFRTELAQTPRQVQPPLAFYIARRCVEIGEGDAVKRLYVEGEPEIKAAVLNALYSPGPFPSVFSVIRDLVLDGFGSGDLRLRVEACRAAQNLAADRCDMSVCVPNLLQLLSDPNGLVRFAAACAVGIFGKHTRYDLNSHIVPLANNLKDPERDVQKYSADALWRLSRRHNITSAIESLVWLLSQEDWDLKEARKNCVGALLHHARKSASNRAEVQLQLDAITGATSNKELRALREKVAAG